MAKPKLGWNGNLFSALFCGRLLCIEYLMHSILSLIWLVGICVVVKMACYTIPFSFKARWFIACPYLRNRPMIISAFHAIRQHTCCEKWHAARYCFLPKPNGSWHALTYITGPWSVPRFIQFVSTHAVVKLACCMILFSSKACPCLCNSTMTTFCLQETWFLFLY